MTHDPLCARTPTGVHYVGTCTCNLIAKVRADEQQRSQDEIYEWRIKASDQYGHGFHEGWKWGHESALNPAH